MRVIGFAVVWFSLGLATAFSQDAPAPATPAAAAPAKTMDAKEAATIASYGIGMNVARSIKSEGLELDLESLIQGIRDGSQAGQPKYTEQQIRAAMMVFQRDAQDKQEKRRQTEGDKNQREGQAFLAANGAKAGVTKLPSGLQYLVLKAGKGASPKATDRVKVHYEGTLLDGKVFDSSIKRNEPAEFQVGGVIPGWTEALQLMKVGDKWRLFIPASLAYGSRGAGSAIGPNAVLVFEVELLGIEAAAKE